MRRILLKLFRRRTMERDIEAELAFHREMAAANANPIPLGNVAVIKEQARDQWRFAWLENLGRDLVYAARGLRRSPGFVAAALLSLALGIGANTAMFSLAVEFLLSEPSVRDPERVVHIRLGSSSHLKPRARQFLDDSGVFDGVAGQFEESYINWDNGQETRRTFAIQATRNFFTVLGVPVAHGRGWNQTDPDGVVVLSHRFWQKHYGADPGVVGRAMRLNGRAYTILGVLPANHRTLIGYGFSPDLYVPQHLPDTVLAGYARLKPGMSVTEARAALQALAQRMDEEMPERYWKYASRIQINAVAAIDRGLHMENKALTLVLFFALLLVLVGLVLMIACVNVAGLILARASTRRQEIAIRLSLGATRGRLLQQFLAESLLLSVIGAVLGFVVAQIVASAIAAVHLPIPLPIHLHIEPDWRVAIYATLLAIASTVMTGLLPAWQSVKEPLRSDLQRDSKLRLRRALVAVQLAVSLVVLTTGALFVRNLLQSAATSPGFDVRNTVRAEVHLPPDNYSNNAAMLAYIDRGLQTLNAVPGIEAAAAARIIPFTDATNHGAEITFPDGEKKHAQFHWNAVSPDYFRAMDIPILAGRTFRASEDGSANAIIVNKTFVQRYLGNRQPIGTTFTWDHANALFQVVGVVAGTKNLTIGEEDKAQMYQPLTQVVNARPRIQFVVRSAIPPPMQLAPVRDALRPIEPTAAVEVTTLYSSIGLAFLPSQVGALLMGGIGVLGLLLAGVGLYGMMAYSVARRTREIGIRVAIGADRSTISRMVLGDCAKLLLIGSIPGLAIALFVTRPLAMFLVPGLSPSDPISFIVVICVLTITGLIAALGPLRRAVSIDPAHCLRYE